jgi:hypothetical protein
VESGPRQPIAVVIRSITSPIGPFAFRLPKVSDDPAHSFERREESGDGALVDPDSAAQVGHAEHTRFTQEAEHLGGFAHRADVPGLRPDHRGIVFLGRCEPRNIVA